MRKFKYSNSTHANLKENGRFQVSLAYSLELYPQDAIYSFIPKNACSTLRYSLAVNNGLINDIGDINWIDENNHTFTANLKSACQAKYTFVILRCPFRRLVSVFLDKFIDVNYPALELKKKHHSIDLDQLTFTEFVKTLCKGDTLYADEHWRPQVDFLLYEEYDDYFCVENMNDAITTLSEKINFKIYDTRHVVMHDLNNLKKVSKYDYFSYTTLELKEMKLKGIIPSYESMYNKELISLVNNLFSEDVKLFNQKFPGKGLFCE